MRTAILLTVMLVASPAAAETRDPCPGIGRIAESVMKRRQDGLSLQSTLDAMNKVTGQTPEPAAAAESMVMDAYSIPRFEGQVYKDRASADFKDAQQLECMKLMQTD